MHAELRLIAWSLQKHDEPASNVERNLPAQVLLDEGKAEIYSRAGTGRRDHRAITHKNPVAFHPRLGEALGQQ